ncbi:hypothetical protein AABM38_10705 [Heyndrickxia sp. MSNUG]|uniref:hypothetical protein n=1 Tax=Heyndrickxia sp. MSNUG TaxID=3136677 RepID=UPI003C2B4B19
MYFSKLCYEGLCKVEGKSINFGGDIFFSLEQIKHLPSIIKKLNFTGDDLGIFPYYVANNQMMDVYWCSLSIRNVEFVQDKENVILSETGKKHINQVPKDIIELWDNTYYEVQNGDIDKLIDYLDRYISWMEKREIITLEECRGDNIILNEEGIFFEIMD